MEKKKMKIVSYNVNGIRSAMNKNFTGWLTHEMPDVLCLQEIKASPDQFDNYMFKTLGYHTYWHPAEKKGYSGVAILSKQKPDNVVVGCGEKSYDCEGRMIRADFSDVSVMSLYMPSGTTGEVRQSFKMDFCENFFIHYVKDLLKQRPKLVLSGDYNIAHREIDIHDPKRNVKTSGFLPEEREWLTRFLDIGMVDSFRYLNPEKQKYSWWSWRAGARKNNKGWRIDYNMISEALCPQAAEADLLNDAVHSDHCPVSLELEIGR